MIRWISGLRLPGCGKLCGSWIMDNVKFELYNLAEDLSEEKDLSGYLLKSS